MIVCDHSIEINREVHSWGIPFSISSVGSSFKAKEDHPPLFTVSVSDFELISGVLVEVKRSSIKTFLNPNKAKKCSLLLKMETNLNMETMEKLTI